VVGATDPETYAAAAAAGRLAQDVPVNHSPAFAPVLQPTCDTGTQALVVAALEWLGGEPQSRGRVPGGRGASSS
jgi:hippurate hydrolase